MDAPYDPIPARLHVQMRELQHDLARARENLASGKLHPEHYARVSRILDLRLEALEAVVEARLLMEAKAPARRVVGMN